MAESSKPERFSLSHWSRRKLEASRAKVEPGPGPSATSAQPAPVAPGGSGTGATPSVVAQGPALPPVESLTIDSDFAVFLQPSVDDSVRRAALRKLFRDPRFNVMDGLDVYVDDYSVTTPIGDDVLRKLAHARSVLDPPNTRVNAQGFVEDVGDHALASPAAAGGRAVEGKSVGGEDTSSVPDLAGEAAAPLSPGVPQPVAASVSPEGAANARQVAPSIPVPRHDPDAPAR